MSEGDLTFTEDTQNALRNSLKWSATAMLNQWNTESFPARRHCSLASFGAGAVQAWGIKYLWLWKDHLATRGTINEATIENELAEPQVSGCQTSHCEDNDIESGTIRHTNRPQELPLQQTIEGLAAEKSRGH